MAAVLSIQWDIKALARDIGAEEKQVPFAASLAINNVMKTALPAVQAEMKRVFDRPTPWTLKSYRVLKFSKKQDLTGIIGFKDTDYKGGPGGRSSSAAGVYLQPLMSGGPRPPKRFEALLRSRGLIGRDEFVVPSKFQRLDQYGNVPRSVVQKVLANLRAGFDPLSHTPTGGARGGKKKADYFFTRAGIRGQRLTAIWQNFGSRGGQRAVPAFVIVKARPHYKRIFDQEKVVSNELKRRFAVEFDAAYRHAIATAHPARPG